MLSGKMKRTADILIAMDCSSSMNWSWEKYIKDCLEQFDQYFLPNSENLRLGFTAFRSHNDPIERYELTTSSEIFQDYLNRIRISNEIPTGSKSTALALEEGLTFGWRSDGPYSIHEKMLILVTDGPPCGIFDEPKPCECKDLWNLVNRYIEQEISILVVGIEPNILTVDDFYCALAKRTGGHYFPLVNATRILHDVLSNWINDRGKFFDLFQRLDLRMDIQLNSQYNYSEMKNRVDFMLKSCRNMSDIRREFYSYLSKTKQRTLSIKPLSSLLQRSCSTPITIPHRSDDDDGYFSAMPTMASFIFPSFILSDYDEYSHFGSL